MKTNKNSRGQAVRGARQQKETSRLVTYLQSLLVSRMLYKAAFLSALIVFAGWAYQQIKRTDILPVETVEIEGEFKYLSKQDIQQRALPHVSGGFFSVDLEQVRNALTGLPWVEDVSIRRYWPNALRIRVIEKQPVAYWGENGLLSSRAVLFEPRNMDRNLGLPKIYGPQGQHRQMLKELGRMQAWLVEAELRIQQVKQDARRSWTLYMDSGLELRLGREKQHERLHRFVEVYTQKLQKQKDKIKHLDMRYTNGFAIAWQKQGQGA